METCPREGGIEARGRIAAASNACGARLFRSSAWGDYRGTFVRLPCGAIPDATKRAPNAV
ncbi:MAG: hypothetical protein LBI59_10150 [Candidatus Accumulibacter sp.]|jgi:hypothetical protein|nr:hypothetical protein [Accumulibacter sp.]